MYFNVLILEYGIWINNNSQNGVNWNVHVISELLCFFICKDLKNFFHIIIMVFCE